MSIGAGLKRRRRRLGVSAAVAAESAGMSRVTLHRIESGAPSVTVGALLNAARAVGLRLHLGEDREPPDTDDGGANPAVSTDAPEKMRVGDYPQLRAAAWQLDADTCLDGFEALRTYERNWRHLDHGAMSSEERARQGGRRLRRLHRQRPEQGNRLPPRQSPPAGRVHTRTTDDHTQSCCVGANPTPTPLAKPTSQMAR